MEYCHSDLHAYIKQEHGPLPEAFTVKLLTQLLVGLKFLHGRKVGFPKIDHLHNRCLG